MVNTSNMKFVLVSESEQQRKERKLLIERMTIDNKYSFTIKFKVQLQ